MILEPQQGLQSSAAARAVCVRYNVLQMFALFIRGFCFAFVLSLRCRVCAFNTRVEGKSLIFSKGIGGLNAAWNMCLLIWGDLLNETCGMLCSDSSVFYSLVKTKFSVHHAQLEHFDATPWGCDYPNGWGLVCGGIEQLCRPTGAVLKFGFNGYACDWTQWVVEQNYIQYFQRLS